MPHAEPVGAFKSRSKVATFELIGSFASDTSTIAKLVPAPVLKLASRADTAAVSSLLAATFIVTERQRLLLMTGQVVERIIANRLAASSSTATKLTTERPFKLAESTSEVFSFLVLVFQAPIHVQLPQQGLLVRCLVPTCK